MAFSINTLTSISQEYIEPQVYDQVSKGCPFFYWLKENGRMALRGGRDIRVPILKQLFNSEWYSGAESSSLEVIDNITSAVYDWKLLRVPYALTEEDIDKNGGETQIVDLVDSAVETCSLTMAEAVAAALMGTNTSDTKKFDGLQDMGAASGTEYAGLTDTDFTSPATWLMNIHSLATANTLTAIDMRNMRGDVTRGAVRPNLGLCNFAVYTKIWSLAQSAQRFGMERIASLGFDHIMFEDMPIMADEHMPGTGYTASSDDNWLIFLNTDYIKFVMHENKAFSSRVYAPTPQQEVYIGKMYLMGNLITTQRRAHSVNKLIDPTN